MSTIDDQPTLLVSDELLGPVTVVRCAGEIDLATVPGLRDRLSRIQLDGPTHLVLDLSEVTFIDSLGLGTLIGAHKRARVLQGSFRVVPSEPVRRVLVATALDRVFDVRASVDDALAERN